MKKRKLNSIEDLVNEIIFQVKFDFNLSDEQIKESNFDKIIDGFVESYTRELVQFSWQDGYNTGLRIIKKIEENNE